MTDTTSCPDCGNAPINHTLYKGAIIFEMVFTPFIYFFGGITHFFQFITKPLRVANAWPRIFKLLATIGLGKIATEPDDKTTSRAKAFWEEARRRGITMWEFQLFGMGREFFVAEYKVTDPDSGETRTQVLSFEGLPRINAKTGKLTDPKSIDWIDNKATMRKKFAKAGIPVARGGKVFSFGAAKRIFNEIQAGDATQSVIIKPHQGSRSRHTTVHIRDEAALKIAFRKAKMLSPFVLIEEELVGMVHRVTLIGGKVIGILRREPPSVFGDDTHTIAELIVTENKNPLRSGPTFHGLVVNEETHSELARQNVTLESVPTNGQIIFLHQKASRGIGGGATDLTDVAHVDNIALFEYIAKYLDDSIVGIDFIIADMKKSWKETAKCGVIECNSLPFIDLHLYPLVGTPRDTAGALWDLVLPESKL
ncbi:MAG: hypothetical protein KBB70_00600 [Candidatus Pacebacteria bacterium]|nr:hypothetical protein [Candidatus Paceibacterota bacterium]